MTIESSHPTVDPEQEKTDLLHIHDLDRQAHFATDVQAAISFFEDSYIYVRDGQIHHQSLSELEQAYSEYFKNATFYEWDNLEEPILRVSNDGSMAWMIARFRARYKRTAENQSVEETFVYAGMTTYEKQNGKWMRTANVSTFEKK